MIDVEVFGLAAARRAHRAGADAGDDLPGTAAVRELCALTAARMGVHDGHLAVAFIGIERMAALNAEHRDEAHATDVLSFPIDGASRAPARAPRAREGSEPERELGDIVICVERTSDVREAIVHGVLHLLGMDHETDDGEMLALQREVLSESSLAASGSIRAQPGR
jgi:probable rRNA maturation factor